MRHAGEAALDRLEPLLQALRRIETLKEVKRGVFYRKSKAFLHFHEDAEELFADLRDGSGEFVRSRVTDPSTWPALVQRATF